MGRRTLALILVGAVLTACGGGGVQLKGPDPSVAAGINQLTIYWEPADGTVVGDDRIFLLYVPESYIEEPTAPLPLVVFLSGNADDFVNNPDGVRAYAGILGAAQVLPHEFAAVVPVPTFWDYSEDTWRADWIDFLITHVEDLIDVDPDRISVTGHSFGAASAIAYGMAYPERPAALVALAGYWPVGHDGAVRTDQLPADLCNAAGIPIRMYHGDFDPIVPLAEAETLAQGLRDCGADVELTIIDGAGHNPERDVFSDIAFYDWLFAQRR